MIPLLLLLAQAVSPADMDRQAIEMAQQGRLQEARALWNQAITAAPAFFPVLFNLAYSYATEQRFPEAAPLLRRAVKANPNSFPAQYLLGNVEIQTGNRDAGIRAWREADRLQPRNAKLLTVLAIEYGKGGYYFDAAAAARRALALQPGDLNTMLVAIKAFHEAQDGAGALRTARSAAETFPDSARARFEYAFHLHRSGRASDSLPHLEAAMKLDPAYEEPFFFYGGLLMEEGRLQEAIAHLRAALRNRPGYTAASVALARALADLGQIDEAIAELRTATERAPDHPQPYLMLSRLLFRKGDEAGAERARERNIELRKANPAAVEQPVGRRFPASASKNPE